MKFEMRLVHRHVAPDMTSDSVALRMELHISGT
jgi:hypothetical protein